MAEYTAETLTINGCSIEMLRGGRGDTLLFLHGAGGIRGWAPYLDRLAERFTVLAPSHPGYGRSDTPDWLDGMSDLVFYYLDFRGIHLVGNSLGGWLAAELATCGTDRFRTVTLVSPAGIHVKGVPKGDIFLWDAETRTRNTFYDQKLADARLSAQPTAEEADIALKNHFTTAKLAWHPRFYNPNLHKWLHRITAPTMILWGDSDKLFPPAYAEAYHKLIPGSQLRIIEHCGHLPHQEKPDDFLAGVAAITNGAAS